MKISKRCTCVCVYLKGSDAELDAETQANVDVIGQEIEEHVMSAEQGDEEEGGLGQAPSAQTEEKGLWGHTCIL